MSYAAHVLPGQTVLTACSSQVLEQCHGQLELASELPTWRHQHGRRGLVPAQHPRLPPGLPPGRRGAQRLGRGPKLDGSTLLSLPSFVPGHAADGARSASQRRRARCPTTRRCNSPASPTPTCTRRPRRRRRSNSLQPRSTLLVAGYPLAPFPSLSLPRAPLRDLRGRCTSWYIHTVRCPGTVYIPAVSAWVTGRTESGHGKAPGRMGMRIIRYLLDQV